MRIADMEEGGEGRGREGRRELEGGRGREARRGREGERWIEREVWRRRGWKERGRGGQMR